MLVPPGSLPLILVKLGRCATAKRFSDGVFDPVGVSQGWTMAP
jgi:hypothetical protein